MVRVPWHASIVLFGCWFECNFIVLELNIFSMNEVKIKKLNTKSKFFCLTCIILSHVFFLSSGSKSQTVVIKYSKLDGGVSCIHIFYLSVYITGIIYEKLFVFSQEIRLRANESWISFLNSTHLISLAFNFYGKQKIDKTCFDWSIYIYFTFSVGSTQDILILQILQVKIPR